MNNAAGFLEGIPKPAGDISEMQILNLAYIGDAVFEVMVRTHIIRHTKSAANELHKAAKGYVAARAQSEMYKALSDKLSDGEMALMRRGRNAKSCTKAKNASVNDYRHATGMEALFGYLYLKNEISRLTEIFEICIETIETIESIQQ